MSSLIPPSEQLVKKTTKDEFMTMNALEEARKKGIAPAELDEEGKEINSHIPHYIVNAPWYVSTGQCKEMPWTNDFLQHSATLIL